MAGASANLKKAIALGEPGGFIRCFVNLGHQMADLIKQQLITQEGNVSYLVQILKAFGEDVGQQARHESDKVQQRYQILPNHLTDRELEIMDLLARGLQNKHIAANLSITKETVKSHLKTIFKKLGASNRQNAVYRAVSFGLISGKS